MKDFKKLEEIWAAYVYEGRMDPSVQPAVAECWKKCRDAGMDPNGGLGRRVDDAVFQSIREANSTLIDTGAAHNAEHLRHRPAHGLSHGAHGQRGLCARDDGRRVHHGAHGGPAFRAGSALVEPQRRH